MSMSTKKKLVTALTILATLSLANPALSQDASVSMRAQNDARTVGTVRSAKWFSAAKFVPKTNSTIPLTASLPYFLPVGAVTQQSYVAQLDLDPGSLVDAIGCFAQIPASNASDFQVNVFQHHVDALGGMGTFLKPLGSVTGGSWGSGTGNRQFYSMLTPFTVVGEYGELTDNHHLDVYFIEAKLTQQTPFMGCWVWYSKQISPAPSTATFTDVPTTHAFFQSIEAVAAAGITTGCAAGKFCPNDYVTRGQMATFLARSLGL